VSTTLAQLHAGELAQSKKKTLTKKKVQHSLIQSKYNFLL